jgi:hypothetical protein
MKNKFDLETSWIWLCAWLWYTVCIPFEYSKRKIRRKSDKFSISYKRYKYALIQAKKTYHRNAVDMPTLVLEELEIFRSNRVTIEHKRMQEEFVKRVSEMVEIERAAMATEGIEYDKFIAGYVANDTFTVYEEDGTRRTPQGKENVN